MNPPFLFYNNPNLIVSTYNETDTLVIRIAGEEKSKQLGMDVDSEDNADFFEWSALYKMYLRAQERLKILKPQ